MIDQAVANLKLYMILLGSKPPGRNVEQHDYFFGIAYSLKELVPAMKMFWPEAGKSLHVDGWREVNQVDRYKVEVILKEPASVTFSKKLFFINLGGYQAEKLEEQHYTLLGVHEDRAQAVKNAKKTIFFKINTLDKATSHVDDKYGIDVDDIYQIEDILAPAFKSRYHLSITPTDILQDDVIHLGYFKLDNIK